MAGPKALEAARKVVANPEPYPQEYRDKAYAIIKQAETDEQSQVDPFVPKKARVGVTSVTRPRLAADGGVEYQLETESPRFKANPTANRPTDAGNPQITTSRTDPYDPGGSKAAAAKEEFAVNPWLREQYRDTQRQQQASREQYARLRGWNLDAYGNPENPDLVTRLPDGRELTEQEIQALPEQEAFAVRQAGQMTVRQPQLETRGQTSRGDFLSQRVFFERDAAAAQKALEENPEVRRLALGDTDLQRDETGGFKLPTVAEGSPLHARVNDALWTILFRQDENAGARLIRAKNENAASMSALGKFARWSQENVLDPAGGALLAADRGLSGGLLQSGVAAAMSPISGLDEVQRLEQARQAAEAENPLLTGVAQIAGAVSPVSVGSGAVRAGGKLLGMAPEFMAPGSLLGNTAIGAGAGLAEQQSQILADTAQQGQVPLDAPNRLLGGAAWGGIGGGLFGLASSGMAKLAQRAEKRNYDLDRLEAAGGRMTGPVVRLPKRLQSFEDESFALRQQDVERTPRDLAARRAGNEMLRAVGNREDGIKRLHGLETEAIHAAAGDHRATTVYFVSKLNSMVEELNDSIVGNSDPFVRAVKRAYQVRYVPQSTNVAGRVSDRSAAALFDDAVDDIATGGAKQSVVRQPRDMSPDELDALTSAIKDKVDFAKANNNPSARRWEQLYGEAIAMRSQFNANPQMNAVARKYGADNYGALKQRQADELTRSEALRNAVKYKGVIPGGAEEVRVRPEQTAIPEDWATMDDGPQALAANRSDYEAAAVRAADAFSGSDTDLFARYAKTKSGPEINKHMRLKNGSAEVAAETEALNEAIRRNVAAGNTYTGPVYRGTRVPKTELDRWIRDGGYTTDTVTSTTVSPALADGYLRDMMASSYSPLKESRATVLFHFARGTKSVPIGGAPTPGGALMPPPGSKHVTAPIGIKFEKEALVPAGQHFRITKYGKSDDGVTHLWVTPSMTPGGRMRYQQGQDLMAIIEQRGGSIQQLRSAILARGREGSADDSEELFKMVSRMDPKSAQALVDVLGYTAAENLRSGLSGLGAAAVAKAQNTIGTRWLDKSLGTLRLTAYSGAKAAAAPLERHVNWEQLGKLRNQPRLWSYLTNPANRNTRAQSGMLPERSGYLSLAGGAGGRAAGQLDLQRLLDAWDAANLLLETARELPEPKGTKASKEPEAETPDDERDTLYQDAGAP